MPLTPAVGSQRLDTSLVYVVSSRPAKTTERDLVTKTKALKKILLEMEGAEDFTEGLVYVIQVLSHSIHPQHFRNFNQKWIPFNSFSQAQYESQDWESLPLSLWHFRVKYRKNFSGVNL